MSFKPLSLAQLFDPPEDYRGIFGWLCGYAADAGFLDEAIERFSGLTNGQRAYQGRIMLGVMLDPGNPQIEPAAVPGVLHLPMKAGKSQFALLHAKVAILCFQNRDQFILRLIVSTGNWTRQTLEDSLDLVWTIDVASDALATKPSEQDRTDLIAAWDFMNWLQALFDLRAFSHSLVQGNISSDASRLFSSTIQKIAKGQKKRRGRFFDNRQRSLFAQLPELVKNHAGKARRNYLAVGSGFFEGAGNSNGAMYDGFVPEQIRKKLQDHALATLGCGSDIFVNPVACQAVAERQSWIVNNGWTIRAARTPHYFGNNQRTLHAKFIFSANYRDDSNKCNSPWVYLGSGNLTKPGFTNKANSSGNLEAGVVFAPEGLKWESIDKRDDGADVVTNLLPIGWGDDGCEPLPELHAGQDMPDRDVLFVAAPIALFEWVERADGTYLVPRGEETGQFDVLNPDGRPCRRDDEQGFIWTGSRPRQVTVRWTVDGCSHVASVPVIDHFGRYCGADLPALDLEDAWIYLSNFPMPPEDEELEGDSGSEDVDGAQPRASSTTAGTSDLPVRRMMTLIEDIAAKQTGIAEADWAVWCNRLEQVLTQAKDSSVVKKFQTFELNPLHPLLAQEFRPAFAATAQNSLGARYEAAIDAAIKSWGLEGSSNLGELT